MEAPDTGNAGVTMLAGVRSAVSSLKAYPGLPRQAIVGGQPMLCRFTYTCTAQSVLGKLSVCCCDLRTCRACCSRWELFNR